MSAAWWVVKLMVGGLTLLLSLNFPIFSWDGLSMYLLKKLVYDIGGRGLLVGAG